MSAFDEFKLYKINELCLSTKCNRMEFTQEESSTSTCHETTEI